VFVAILKRSVATPGGARQIRRHLIGAGGYQQAITILVVSPSKKTPMRCQNGTCDGLCMNASWITPSAAPHSAQNPLQSGNCCPLTGDRAHLSFTLMDASRSW